jgi:hypothetical protein
MLVNNLKPCSTARARLVDSAGKPVTAYPWRRIAMVVTPAARRSGSDQPGNLIADAGALSAIDPINYGNGPVSDAEGRITFPALIPGATYRIVNGPRGGPALSRRKFTVKPGETVDLGDFVIEKPQK